MKKSFYKFIKGISAISVLAASSFFFGCQMLQDSLHSEMQKQMDEDTGIASIEGGSWYFDGCATDNVAGSTGTTLLVTFNKKVAIEADSDGNSKLSGSMSITYNSTSGEKKETYKIDAGKIKYFANSDSEYKGEELGALSASGKEYRIDMTPAVKFLTGKKAVNNELSVELKLSGFVCDEGDQKGRSVGVLSKKVKVTPLYNAETLAKEITFTTAESTLDATFTIPTLGPVKLVDENDFTITVSDSSIKTNRFFLSGTKEGVVLGCWDDLQGKEFTAKITINGIVPAASGSSYSSRTFNLDFTKKQLIVKTKDYTGEGSKKYAQLFTKEDMSEYDEVSTIVVNLIYSDWGGSENNWWALYADSGCADASKIGANDSGAVWSGETASLEIDAKWFEQIMANGIYIEADKNCFYTFTVTYR